MEEFDVREQRKKHYQKLLPLLQKARSAIDECLDSDEEWVRLQAGRFVLNNQENWLKGATGQDPEKDRLTFQPVSAQTLESEALN